MRSEASIWKLFSVTSIAVSFFAFMVIVFTILGVFIILATSTGGVASRGHNIQHLFAWSAFERYFDKEIRLLIGRLQTTPARITNLRKPCGAQNKITAPLTPFTKEAQNRSRRLPNPFSRLQIKINAAAMAVIQRRCTGGQLAPVSTLTAENSARTANRQTPEHLRS